MTPPTPDVSDVEEGTVGTYTVHYAVTDNNSNPASATRTVHVVDTTPPDVTLNGESTIYHRSASGNQLDEPGVVCHDDCDTSTMAITMSWDVQFDQSTLGDYVRTYTCTD